jgi:micrococcal nuclease
MFTAFLFLTGASFVSAQTLPPRDPSQIRNDTSRRNRALDNPANNPFNRNNPTSGTGRFLDTNRIFGSEIRRYVLAAQADTEVKVLSVSEGDKLLVDDGTNQVVVRILGIDAPELGQPQFEEAKKNLSDLLTGKKAVLVYSLHNLRDEHGYFLARVFIAGRDVGLNLLENGLAWRNANDKFFLDKKDDAKNKQAEAKARSARTGLWQTEKPQKPWEYRNRKMKEMKKAEKKNDKN